MVSFNKHYFFAAVLIFITEVLIALFVRDQWVRPYLGDVLVVILIYCFIKSFFNLPVIPLASGVLVFAFTIEILQYFKFIKLLGLEDSKIARTVFGTSFAWIDLLSYMAGIGIVLVIEKYKRKTIWA